MPDHSENLSRSSGDPARVATPSAFRLYAPEECTGRDGYPPAWHATIKHEVRAAAENRCVRCHHPYEKGAGEWSPCDWRCHHGGPARALIDGETVATYDGKEPWWHHHLLSGGRETGVEAAWRILTVHHLNGDKHDCRWWNLVALCQRCHLSVQTRVQMARVWPWEHTPWFRPYVAGYYAWAYLGENLDRPEVEARLDDLLALERAA